MASALNTAEVDSTGTYLVESRFLQVLCACLGAEPRYVKDSHLDGLPLLRMLREQLLRLQHLLLIELPLLFEAFEVFVYLAFRGRLNFVHLRCGLTHALVEPLSATTFCVNDYSLRWQLLSPVTLDRRSFRNENWIIVIEVHSLLLLDVIPLLLTNFQVFQVDSKLFPGEIRGTGITLRW